MTKIACTLTRRLAPLLGAAVAVAVLGCREDAQSPMAPEPEQALEVTPAVALSFRQVSAGAHHACGVTTDNRVFCWGLNDNGQLGNGTNTGPQRCFTVPCSTRPVAVAGGLRFRRVSAGGGSLRPGHTCGVTTGSRIYCWGNNRDGQLGDGTFRTRLVPVLVAGGLQFLGVSAGPSHTCAVTTDNRAFCWGNNAQGRLGDGTVDSDRPRPAAVTGGLFFRQVSAGADYSCGVTTVNRAFCWGNNSFGQLGTTGAPEGIPVAVSGGHRFRQVTTSMDFHHPFTCAVTTADRAFCWGIGEFGELGNGEDLNVARHSPTAVAGGLLFRQVSANDNHTCGVTTGNLAYCWGANHLGQLGDGTTTQRVVPAAVAGGLQFRQADGGEKYSCAVTTDDRAFCWGRNRLGQLGDGTRNPRLTPTPVAGVT
jgi:alpha-tubulin suppressor-like RCC1 family protein